MGIDGCASSARHERLDRDGDGHLNEIELSAAIFGEWDTDNDGLIDGDEFEEIGIFRRE